MKTLFVALTLVILLPLLAQAAPLVVTVKTDRTSYSLGQTIRSTAYVTDAGIPVLSLSTSSIAITDAKGAVVAKGALSSLGSGYYGYNYLIPATAANGTWTISATVFLTSGASASGSRQTTVGTGGTVTVSGQSIYDSRCAGCHSLGTYDAVGAPNLLGRGSVVPTKFAVPHNGITLTAAEITAIQGFIDNPAGGTPVADTTAPATSASPAAGTYSGTFSVTLTANEAATIYYTTNGATPTTASAKYTAPISVAATTTIRYFAVDTAGNAEAVKSATYTISATAPPVTVSGQSIYDSRCTGCHSLGTYDTSGAPNLLGRGSVVPTKFAVPHNGITLTAAEITAIQGFIDNPTGTPPAGGGTTGTTHGTLAWNGYGTCLTCHTTQANAVHGSVHYQWRGPSPQITNHSTSGGKNAGAMSAFCMNILGNWNGCNTCHVGLGAAPTAAATQAQLENIDCLICHQDQYKRTKVNGLYQPDTAAMTITMDQAVNTVHRPTRTTCLKCHAQSEIGDAVKRGDLAMAHGTTADRSFDVHMATSGANLSCQACHTTSNHKIAGRGSDLRPNEGAAAMTCATASCHSTKTGTSGHLSADVNKHMARVACQTCHIPTYARNANDTAGSEATETHRDWQIPVPTGSGNSSYTYRPSATMANNLMPVYSFWNGTSWGYNLFDPAVLDPATGAYKISRPQGGINDATSKLYPFKYKTSNQPRATLKNQLIAIDTGSYFTSGNVNTAVQSGLVNMGYSAGEPYAMVKADDYLLITHEVPPAGQALACSSCHGSTSRMDLKGKLGYGLKGPTSTVCTQCHGSEANPGFTSIHSKHVASERYDCSLCHNFSRPERGLKTTR